jgi:carbonic anhydrase
MKDPRTPLVSKILLWLAISYVILPFDLIPDFIPIIGQIDDLIIVPILVIVAVKLVPKKIVEDIKKNQVDY